MILNLDCRHGLAMLPDNSVDAILTDPPYEIGFMGNAWDRSGIAYDVAMWRDVNPEKSAESNRIWYEKNRAKKLAADKRRRESNLQKFLERERASYVRHRATSLAKNAKWRTSNRPTIAAHAAKRRSAKAERTPPWLSVEQHEAILKFHIDASELSETTGILHHVDHVVPLRGKTVSGLHVPWNMQILTAIENLKKNNRYAA